MPLAVLLLVVALGADSLYAATLKVPGSYATIQAAIDAASAGDTIKISSGTFTENIVIDKKLRIRGKSKTKIVAADASLAVITIEADRVELKKLDISGGRTGVLAIRFAQHGSLARSVDRLKLKSLRVHDARFDGIALYRADNVSIDKCSAYDNGFQGIRLAPGVSGVGGTIKKCRVYRNGDGIEIEGGQGARIDSCRVYENRGTGIACFSTVDIRLVKNRCKNNRSSGMSIGGAGEDSAIGGNTVNMRVEKNVFENNGNNGFAAFSAQGTVSGNVSKNNSGHGFRCASEDGTEFGDTDGGPVIYKNNTAQDNEKAGFFSGNYSDQFFDNMSIDNGREGFALTRDFSETGSVGFGSIPLEGNLASGNAGHGFYLAVEDSRTAGGDGDGGPAFGLRLVGKLIGNSSLSNGGDGFHVPQYTEGPGDSDPSLFKDNIADGNSGFGFVDLNAGFNTYEGNECGNNAAGSSNPVGLCD